MSERDKLRQQVLFWCPASLLDAYDAAQRGPDWIPITERLPEGSGWVLCSHPVLGINGVVIRGVEEVRSWATDPEDKSMIEAYETALNAIKGITWKHL